MDRVLKKIRCINCSRELVLNSDGYANGYSFGHIRSGYGSKFDGIIMFIGICDDCVEGFLKDNKLEVREGSSLQIVGDYLFNSVDRECYKRVKGNLYDEDS